MTSPFRQRRADDSRIRTPPQAKTRSLGGRGSVVQTKLGAVFGKLPMLTTFNDHVPPEKRLLMVHVPALPGVPEPQAVG